MTFFNLIEVELGFHKTCPLCDTRLQCLYPLQQSTYLVISYNEDNTKLLLTLFLFLEVFANVHAALQVSPSANLDLCFL
ncbi:hypothetical protein K443DRAFT_686617 [Laccaria amethystina LaAM-08-1]|uniref:Uncharacterized protein n=1 Tax=Laccaria amethystina LaAM-08-1 TaxID=1095629 RepID=A0A0C9X293_9AGAR|nr:hypothetical protein K443DRAFT_686617 [Laccaria amethystina LaAM-08-1]